MTFPPETPQDYCDYFQGMLSAKPPDPKWEVGLRAARMWRDYCEQDRASANSQVLISLVKVLMPVRFSGSLLLGLWQQVLRHFTQLPIQQQKDIWLEVFNTENQGEKTIISNAAAHSLIQHWLELVNSAPSSEAVETAMMDMVKEVDVQAFNNPEWFALTMAIDEWFKGHIKAPSFFDAVCGKVDRRSD